jgi:hypothetical protein
MRLALAVLLVVAAGSIAGTSKAAPRWCAISNQGASNCSFTTLEQCRAEVAGMGGSCMPEAPVGHRQPRAADIPPNVPKDETDKGIEQLNRKLDRDMQICRGC